MIVQVGRQRVRVAAGREELSALAAEFSARHVVRLPGFLDSAMLGLIDTRLATARFEPRLDEHGIEIEHTLDDEALAGLFTITLNDPDLFDIVRGIAACGPIGCFTGRVYRRAKPDGEGHYYPWHDDVSHGRMVGLSVNLSVEPYSGGVLQIREAGSARPIAEAANTARGDALLFRIASGLEHQVTPVTSDSPRLVVAGWFCAQPGYLDRLKAHRPGVPNRS